MKKFFMVILFGLFEIELLASSTSAENQLYALLFRSDATESEIKSYCRKVLESGKPLDNVTIAGRKKELSSELKKVTVQYIKENPSVPQSTWAQIAAKK